MKAYVLETDMFIKIGVSKDIETRIATYKDVKRYEVLEIGGDYLVEKARFFECGMMDKFNSETEFLSGEDFDDVLEYAKQLIKKLPNKTFYFMPLMIELVYNEDGYIDLENVTQHINNERLNKSKPMARIDKYMITVATKKFFESIEKTLKVKPCFGKRGRYGGTYVLPYVVLDYLCWADVSLKIKVYEYMYTNLDYLDFIDLCKKQPISVIQR